MSLLSEKPTRKGGRSARRAARVNAPVIHQPALMRNVPVYEVVNAEGVEQIHELAMRIVENIGVDFRDAESLDIWKKTDAEIQGERVRVSRDTLMALVDQAPPEYVHHARNPERTVTVGGHSMVVSPSYGPPYIYDLEGKRRTATLVDLHNLQKLNHMASSVHIAGGPVVEPMDIPVPYRHLYMAYSGFKYSDKPIIGNVTARERAEDTIEMCKVVFGDDFATNNCCTTSLINANSPLVWDATMLDALKIYAANNHAVMCSPFSMAAASTPASNVGTMAVVTAEALSAIAFAQLVIRATGTARGSNAVWCAGHDRCTEFRCAGTRQPGFGHRPVSRWSDGAALRHTPPGDRQLCDLQIGRHAGCLRLDVGPVSFISGRCTVDHHGRWHDGRDTRRGLCKNRH